MEAAWNAVETHLCWKEAFQHLLRHKNKNQAVLAIARRLLVAIWHGLTDWVADKHAILEVGVAKLMRWSWALTNEPRGGADQPTVHPLPSAATEARP